MRKRPDSHLNVGDIAPDFSLPDADEEIFVLSDEIRKHPVLLVFYPSDFGVMCSIEMREFKELKEKLDDLGIEVVWINTDSTRSHRAWRARADIPFRLLSDSDFTVSKDYGVFLEEDGLLKNFSNRALFLVGRDGRILYKWVGLRPATNPPLAEMIEEVERIFMNGGTRNSGPAADSGQ